MSLRNSDYTDRELLHIVDECTTEDGYATTFEIADRLYADATQNGARRYVGSRMAWMVNYGFCARDPERPGHYKLTKDGRDLMSGRLKRSVETALTTMSDGDRALALRTLASATFDHAGPQQAFFRREYQNRYDNRVLPRKRRK